MKEVKIKCVNLQKYNIEVYKNNILICKGNVKSGEFFYFDGKINNVYVVKVYDSGHYYCIPIIILKNNTNNFIFSFSEINSQRKITIYLNDKNYNLRVERGEITLWQSLTQ